MHTEALIRQLFHRQHGAATRNQLMKLGATPGLVRQRLESGAWVAVHPGVYRPSLLEVTPLLLLTAACLARAPGAFASHHVAAWLWGMLEKPTLEITVPPLIGSRLAGVVVHRSADTSAITTRRGVPVTNPLRSLVELGAVAPREDVELALDRGVASRLFTPSAVAAEAQRRSARGRRARQSSGRSSTSWARSRCSPRASS